MPAESPVNDSMVRQIRSDGETQVWFGEALKEKMPMAGEAWSAFGHDAIEFEKHLLSVHG